MNKYLILFLFTVNFILAQDNPKEIMALLNKHPKKDTTRCYYLNKLIESENDENIWVNYNLELQQITLKKGKSEKNKTIRKTYIKYLSIAYNNNGAYELYKENYTKAINWYKKSSATANGIQYHYGTALALQNIGTAYDYSGKIDSTLAYMKKAYKYSVLSGDKSGLAYIVTDLGYIYNNLGNNQLSIKYNLQALKLFETLNDKEGLERTYFALGRIFDNQNDFKSSINYYKKCLQINEETNNTERITIASNSLANAYTNSNQLDLAIKHNTNSFSLAKKTNNNDFIAYSLKTFGDIYFNKKEFTKAKSHYIKAADIFQKINANLHLCKTYIKIATILNQQNELSKAQDYALKAYKLTENTKFPSDKKNAAEILSQVYFKSNDYRKAYDYKAIASEIAEKIYYDESKEIALKATYKYETGKKESEINQLKQQKQISELQSQRKSILIYTFIGSIIGLALLSYFFFNRFKTKKQNELLKIQLQEAEKTIEAEKKASESEIKALRSQMNPHFIFNALNSIQEQFMYGDKIKANEQMSNFTYLTRQILNVSGKKLITVASEIEILTKYLELEKMRFQSNFEYTINCSDNVDEDYLQIPPMLIQPFAENSIKHGLLHKEGLKKITIIFDYNESEELIICTIEDNGIGREKSAAIKTRNENNHQSFSTDSIAQRLTLLDKTKKIKNLIVYEDIRNTGNEVTGTKVTLKIPVN
ncbi:tetratricopeptide repeat protein [Flavobacterium amniphilum]|uniref:tetratricopeptide repeat protein n=1 Tax=Flavobacterium amniphilum TaxID=1834035 RepID=UPI00202A50EB|nr:tetratricopeptide repeat protein [Flavobacterium amniphilum]MCL9805786.1 tetratricopeptide repeat protein [Flavobacterium amniphilum]MCL9806373.1 tetratricopeptide repeat protein [Flavobacterium amniphilum]